MLRFNGATRNCASLKYTIWYSIDYECTRAADIVIRYWVCSHPTVYIVIKIMSVFTSHGLHRNQILSVCTSRSFPPVTLSSPPPPSLSLLHLEETPICFLSRWVSLLFVKSYILQHVLLSAWPLSRNMIVFESHRVVMGVSNFSSLFIDREGSTVRHIMQLFIHLLMDIGFFQFSPITHKAVIKVSMQDACHHFS